MFYIVRTLSQSATRILIKRNDVPVDADGHAATEYGYVSRGQAEERAATVPGTVAVWEFKSDAEARAYCDPACVAHRNAVDAKLGAIKMDDAAWNTATRADGAIVEADTGAAIVPPLTAAQNAIANADAYLGDAVLPTYSELLAMLQKLANGATRPLDSDSCGRQQCKVLAVNVDAAKALLARHDKTMAGDFGAAGYHSAEAAERRMGC